MPKHSDTDTDSRPRTVTECDQQQRALEQRRQEDVQSRKTNARWVGGLTITALLAIGGAALSFYGAHTVRMSAHVQTATAESASQDQHIRAIEKALDQHVRYAREDLRVIRTTVEKMAATVGAIRATQEYNGGR